MLKEEIGIKAKSNLTGPFIWEKEFGYRLPMIKEDLSMIDDLDAKIKMVEKALDETEVGGFSNGRLIILCLAI